MREERSGNESGNTSRVQLGRNCNPNQITFGLESDRLTDKSTHQRSCVNGSGRTRKKREKRKAEEDKEQVRSN